MTLEEKTQALKKITERITACSLCRLATDRNRVVPGVGDPKSKILFVGEAPGFQEDRQGVPFCGPAGKFLDQMLESVDLDRERVFIANIIKCRPPENRDPEEDEKNLCWQYLKEQIEIIDPKLIVCLGRHSMMRLIPGQGSISKIHGQPLRRPDGRIYLPLYHPSAALHNGSLRPVQLKDFQKIPQILKKIEEESKTKINVCKQKLL